MTILSQPIEEMKRPGIWNDVALMGRAVVREEEDEKLKRLGVHYLAGENAMPEQMVGALHEAVEARCSYAS